ncbi:MAG TPA: ribonuclease Y [Candidatus Cloacimonadota bacterium]|jgi:ribonuclease Y|nr:ribonuclease Y [Candidatus Cloacimonadales bacterium]HPY96094.1 ribonuclease Y [Candidatus Cloacimonadota bacterium]HQB40738.1 ribonuclease Y [Candidatus Cloacimonadota bacterium]
MLTYIIAAVVGLVLGFLFALFIYFAKKNTAFKMIAQTEIIAKELIEDAKKESQSLKKKVILDAKEDWFKTQKGYENEIKERQKEVRNLENKFNERVNNFDKRLEAFDKKENTLSEIEKKLKSQEEQLSKKSEEVHSIVEEQKKKLEDIAGMTKDQAVSVLREEMKQEARTLTASEIRQDIEQLKIDANKKAAEIISTAIQRLAVDHISETTVAVVSLPSDEMKGRIIGREGRNIRAFEKASGVDLIIDDTPEAVVLSCFDPVRREIARLSLEKLISDGRIHPGRIEELIEKTRKEMDANLITIGEKACLDTNIHNISPNLIKLIGRLHYRTSYGQNVLNHSIEAAWICGIMAKELGLDQEIARRCGFLHDIGKAIDHEFDGSHAVLGANFARKNGESRIVVNAIESHHEEVEAESVYAVLAQASDAISGARPGARREMLETYMQRLEKLEEIANAFEGVNKSFAIQAGRELRIIVDPANIDDNQTMFIAMDIAKQIEKEIQYPGQIKVTVLRETRQTAVAK